MKKYALLLLTTFVFVTNAYAGSTCRCTSGSMTVEISGGGIVMSCSDGSSVECTSN